MSALRKLAAAVVVLASVQSAEAMDYSYSLYKEHLAITATGAIEEGDGHRFELFLKTVPQDLIGQRGNFVFFDSPGGVVSEGMKIGRAIERNHFMTGITGEQCSSACVLAWAAGERPTLGSRYVYRIVYEELIGPLPRGKGSHHGCEHKWCINPWHTEVLSQSEHNRAHGLGGDWGQAKKTHCPAGHPYDEENTYHTRGERQCRACKRESLRDRRVRLRQGSKR